MDIIIVNTIRLWWWPRNMHMLTLECSCTRYLSLYLLREMWIFCMKWGKYNTRGMVVGLRYFWGWKFCQSSLCPTFLFKASMGKLEFRSLKLIWELKKKGHYCLEY